MKRVIKYYNRHASDGYKFSDCSTEYEILPMLVPDSAGIVDLCRIASELGTPPLDKAASTPKSAHGYRPLIITHAVKVGEIPRTTNSYRGETETFPQYLGFITLPTENALPLKESIGNDASEYAYAICNHGGIYGISAIGQTVDDRTVLVKSDWGYYHCIPLLGYSLQSFEDALNVTEHGFDDDTDSCADCGQFDSRDDGYRYNFREYKGDYLGVNCGCYEKACKDNYDEYIDNADKALEGDMASALESAGELEHVERFIGGMVDGRGGYYDGERVREGNPKDVLKSLKAAYPDSQYLFSIDETGQFQTYFSVWEVTK